MILQVNATGGWREVAEVEPHQLRQVKEAAQVLAQALATGREATKAPSFRIIRERARAPKVLAHIEGRS